MNSMRLDVVLWIIRPLGLRRFVADRRGNMVILFSLTLVPILGFLGLGVDYSMTLRAKTALDASVDAAVLAAATEASQIIQTQSSSGNDATEIAIQFGTLAGQQVFQANSAAIKTSGRPDLTLNLQRQGFTITASGHYTAQWPTIFGKMFSTPVMSFAGQASSQLLLPKYMKIFVATDISQSMGIAATQNDMSTLSNLTGGCVFGCHVLASGSSGRTNEQIAHDNNVELRIDVIKQSIQSIISSAKQSSSTEPTISIGLYTVQDYIPSDGTQYYVKLMDPTTDYDALSTAANTIDLGNNDGGGTGDSNFDGAVSRFSSTEVGTSGDGSSSNSSQIFVFLMTDGVQDVKGNCGYGHCTKAFDPALCADMRSRGVTVGVIYTTYIPFPNEQSYMDLVYPFQPQIAPNLRTCASTGYYYEASDGPSIRAAVNALFAQAVAAGRLTQ